MNKIAWITHGRIRYIFNTPLTLDEWKNNHSPKNLYIDVTHQNVFVGDDILIDSDDTYQIIPKEQWYLNHDKEDKNILESFKKARLQELESMVDTELWKSFRLQSSYYPRLIVILENDAIDYLKNGTISLLLKEIAAAEEMSVEDIVDEILKSRRKVLEVHDNATRLYVKYKQMIEEATTVEELDNIDLESIDPDAV